MVRAYRYSGKKAALGTLTALLLLLPACSTKDAPGGNSPVEMKDVKKDPVELIVYYPFPQDWSEEEFQKTFAEPIQAKYPYMSFKYIVGGKMQDLITAGQKLDIVFASTGASVANLLNVDLQYDITPLIKKHGYDLSRIDPAILDQGKQMANGALYGLPVYVPPSAIYYNKDLFDKFGVPYPQDGLTWDDLAEINKKMTRSFDGVQYFGIGASYNHQVLLNQMTIPLVDSKTKKVTFDTDPRWNTWVQNFVRFYKLPGNEQLKSNQLNEPNERNRFFKDRTVAMFMALTALHTEKEINDMNWDLAPFPSFKDNPGVGPQAYPAFFYVTSTSDHKDDAFDAIAYLTSDEYQTQRSKEGKFLSVLNNQSIRQMFGQENGLYKGKHVAALQPAKYAPAGAFHKYNTTVNGDLGAAIKDIIMTNKDINTALRETAEKSNKKIEEAETASGGK